MYHTYINEMEMKKGHFKFDYFDLCSNEIEFVFN